MSNEAVTKSQIEFSISNAGMVLLSSYFTVLLENLNLVKNNTFITDKARLNSISCLQYLVSGTTETNQSHLALSKILVGLSPNTNIDATININQNQKQLIDDLIQSAIDYWPAIGKSSINGFRGNWLMRNGILRETEDIWELFIEKRSYDLLLERCPFSFSNVKLPWMVKPLQVTWPL